MTDKEIGAQIKKARLEKGLSQENLGEKLGVTWEMISRYENGRSSARKYLPQMAEILEKSINYFYKEYNNPSFDSKEIIKDFKGELKNQNLVISSKVILIDDLAILGFERSLKFAQKYYTAPDWIIEKYNDVFALRLDGIEVEGFEKNSGDVGFFVLNEKTNRNAYVLEERKDGYHISKFNKAKGKVLAVLIMQEKRF